MSAGPFLGKEIAYVNGELHVEGVDLKALAMDPDVATPAYIYSLALMKRRYTEFSEAMREIDTDAMICFAVKSLSNQTVLKKFVEMGAGADLVTGGELERALRAGFAGDRIVFSGLGKTEKDVERAIAANVQINVESLHELDVVKGKSTPSRRARIAIRLNPQLEVMRSDLGQITTGKPDSKFGIPWEIVRELLPTFANTFPCVDLVGVSVHVGSNMEVDGLSKASFRETFKFLTNTVVPTLSSNGVPRPVLDLGGGVAIDYSQTPQERALADESPNRWLVPYKDLVKEHFGELVRQGKVQLVFEPGRFLSGEAGVLLTRVLYVKSETENQNPAKAGREAFEIRFLIVDAGMNDLMRPCLYGAYHHIVPVRYAEPDIDNVDICGPVCETTDSFMRPTREWLRRYDTIFEGSAAIETDDATARSKRVLQATESVFGEVTPKYPMPDKNDRRVYEYFMKRRFPSSIKEGALLAILNAGAYGAVMSSEYNSRPLIPEVLVDKEQYAVIRKRPNYDALIGRDCDPAWKS